MTPFYHPCLLQFAPCVWSLRVLYPCEGLYDLAYDKLQASQSGPQSGMGHASA